MGIFRDTDGVLPADPSETVYAVHNTTSRTMIGQDSPTIGIVGGGQLGRMIGEAAAPLGVDIVVSDPTPDPPAARSVTETLEGDFADPQTIERLARMSDVLTYEIELADPDVLARVSDNEEIPVHPDPDTLRLIQDKLVQNRALADAGIPVPSFRKVDDRDDLIAAIDDFGYPVMVKARRGGYDGRGNFRVESDTDVDWAIEEAPGAMLVEDVVDFDREISVISVKGAGELTTFPVGENVHENEILRETIVPARTSNAVREDAQAVAQKVLEMLDGRGAYGIELFEVDGEILVNEIAPRVHNSGHYTIEGAATSQFEQHVRAILGWPLGSTDLRAPVVMANLLGDSDSPRPATLEGVDHVLETSGASLHWYGKRDVRPLRKMGHVTVVPTKDEDRADLLATARRLVQGLSFT